jgi:hypothetical protein
MPRFALLLVLPLAAAAQPRDQKKDQKVPPPRVLYTMPLVVRPAEKQKLVIRGQGLAGVKEVRVAGVEGAKVTVLAAKAAAVPNNYPAERVGDSEVELELELPMKAKPGKVSLTALGTGGESKAHVLLLRDAIATIIEKEPNDGFNQAQGITLPAAVEGTIKSERDPDVYRFAGKKGSRIRIELEAARFGSPLDGVVTIHDDRRAVVDFVDDPAGAAHTDPVLVVTLPRDGDYFISVIDAHDLGGVYFGYRLVVRKE